MFHVEHSEHMLINRANTTSYNTDIVNYTNREECYRDNTPLKPLDVVVFGNFIGKALRILTYMIDFDVGGRGQRPVIPIITPRPIA